MRDFNHPSICWQENAAGKKQSRRFLECVDDIFPLQVIHREANEERCCAASCSHQQRGAGGKCEVQGQPWLKRWNSGSLEQQGGHIASSLPWTSGEQTLAS